MNAQEARNRLALEKLKRQLRDGSITQSELKARLLRALREEESKGAARMDTAFMLACEELLWQLHAPLTEAIPSGRREGWLRLRENLRKSRPARANRGFFTAGAALAGAAVVMGLFFLTLPHLRPQTPAAAPADSFLSPLPLSESQREDIKAVNLSTRAAAETPLPTPEPTPLPTPEATPAPTFTPAPLPTQEPAFTSAPLLESAGPKYLSFEQLKRQTPARFRWDTADGGQIDAPITLPAGGRLPVLRLRWIETGSQDALQQKIREISGNGPQQQVILQHSYFNVTATSSGSSFFDGPTARPLTGSRLMQSESPENNAFSPDQALKLMREIAGAVGADGESVIIYKKEVTSGRYPVLDYNARDGRVLDESKPVEGYEQGYYILTGAQTFEGAVLFPEDYHYGGPHYGLSSGVHATILNKTEFSANGNLLRRDGVKIDDPPLADAERVLQNLRAMVAMGQLESVEDIQLGYELYYENYVNPKDEEALQQAPLLAVPVWRVLGRARSDPRIQPAGMVRGYESESETYGCELRFNAQTGEFMPPEHEGIKTYNPALLTWAQLEAEGDVSLYNK